MKHRGRATAGIEVCALMAAGVKGNKNSNSEEHREQATRTSLAQPRPAELRCWFCPGGCCVCRLAAILGTEAPWRGGKTIGSEVHGTVGQVVLAADVADLLGLHSLEFGAVGDPMAQAPAEGTAALSWGNGDRDQPSQGPGSMPWTSGTLLGTLGPCFVFLNSSTPSCHPPAGDSGIPLRSHLQCPAWTRPRSAAPAAQAAPSAWLPAAALSGPSALTHLVEEWGSIRAHPGPCGQNLGGHRQGTRGIAKVALVTDSPQALLMKVVAMPVFPERPVRPIRCTVERGTDSGPLLDTRCLVALPQPSPCPWAPGPYHSSQSPPACHNL